MTAKVVSTVSQMKKEKRFQEDNQQENQQDFSKKKNKKKLPQYDDRKFKKKPISQYLDDLENEDNDTEY